MLNADETLLTMHGDELGLHVFHRKDRDAGVTAPAGYTTIGSLTPIIGLGKCWMIAICLKKKHKHLKLWVKKNSNKMQVFLSLLSSLRSTHSQTRVDGEEIPVVYYTSDSGLLNAGLWEKILARFHQVWSKQHKGLRCFLLTDNLSFHRNPKIVSKALYQQLIFQIFLPPNTSHICQPLDQAVFANFKRYLDRLAKELLKVDSTLNAWDAILLSIPAAVDMAFSEKVIRASWKKAHIWPLDKTGLIETARINSGEPPVTVLSSPILYLFLSLSFSDHLDSYAGRGNGCYQRE